MRPKRMPDIMENGVNVTPLIDIVMCMIIFFMLVAKIGINNGAEKIDIPTSILGIDPRQMGNTIILNVVNGPANVPDAQPGVDLLVGGRMENRKLHDVVNGKMTTPLRDALVYLRGINPNVKVIIRGDKTLTYRFLAPVLLECNLAQMKSFAFDTKKPS